MPCSNSGWKYEVSNQDHVLMQGVEAVDHVLLGAAEETFPSPNLVNAGKRRQAPSSPGNPPTSDQAR